MLRIPKALQILPGAGAPLLDKIDPMTNAELERFLLDFSLEEQRQVRELWKAHAARKTLIDFELKDGS